MTFEQLLEEYKEQKVIIEEKDAAIEEKDAAIEEKGATIEEKGATIDKMQARISQMQFQIDQMNRLLYGAKRERFISNTDDNQLSLPFEVPQEEEPEKQQEVITYVREKNKRKEHPGRLALPSHLPVEEIVLEPEEDTTNMKFIGKEVTDQLELVPAERSSHRCVAALELLAERHGDARADDMRAPSARRTNVCQTPLVAAVGL